MYCVMLLSITYLLNGLYYSNTPVDSLGIPLVSDISYKEDSKISLSVLRAIIYLSPTIIKENTP